MENVKRCAFLSDFNNKCIALTVNECDGLNTNCSYYKTKEEHEADTDRAIDICRKKGLCRECRYRAVPCSKKSEENNDRRRF